MKNIAIQLQSKLSFARRTAAVSLRLLLDRLQIPSTIPSVVAKVNYHFLWSRTSPMFYSHYGRGHDGYVGDDVFPVHSIYRSIGITQDDLINCLDTSNRMDVGDIMAEDDGLMKQYLQTIPIKVGDFPIRVQSTTNLIRAIGRGSAASRRVLDSDDEEADPDGQSSDGSTNSSLSVMSLPEDGL